MYTHLLVDCDLALGPRHVSPLLNRIISLMHTVDPFQRNLNDRSYDIDRITDRHCNYTGGGGNGHIGHGMEASRQPMRCGFHN